MDINSFFQILSYPFVTKALVVGVLVALCAALLGVILILKHYSLIGHGLGDVGFASISLALALGISPIYVAMPIVIVAAILIMFFSQRKGVAGDVAIGIVATSALSLGVIITALTNGFNVDVYNYMFGSILALNNADVILSVVLSVIVIGVFILCYNRLFLITSDEDFAKASGINVGKYQFLIAFLTGVTVVIGMEMMGSLLISSLIIFPGVTGKKIARSFKGLIIIAAIISVFCLLVGLLASFLFSIPTGACIVAANIVLLLIVTLIKKIIQ